MAAPGDSGGGAEENVLKLVVPQHAMGMIIGKGGAGIRDFECVPELTQCRLEEQRGGGIMTVTGSVRSLVVVAERIDDIINLSYERNVRRHHGHFSGAPARQWQGERDRGRPPQYRPRRLSSPQLKRRRSESPETRGRNGHELESDHD